MYVSEWMCIYISGFMQDVITAMHKFKIKIWNRIIHYIALVYSGVVTYLFHNSDAGRNSLSFIGEAVSHHIL